MVQVTWCKGGTGKAEDAKLPGAGIWPEQCPEKCVAEKGATTETQLRIEGNGRAANEQWELLVAKGDHRIDAHRAASGNVAGQQGDQDEHDGYAEERQRIGWLHAEEQAR
jgi:hypothetical protein